MKKKKKQEPRTQKSWQEIRQTANRKMITAYARKRLLGAVLRGCFALALVAGIAGTVFAGIRYWGEGVERFNKMLPEQPLREVAFNTDGTLTAKWFRKTLEWPEEIDMRSIDIREVRDTIESHGQVRSATVRRLPNRLLVNVRERFPIARVALRGEEGRIVIKVVDNEGQVYEGVGYNEHELASLPFLDGIQLRRDQGGGYRPLTGMDRVEELLDTTREYAPHIYRTWKVVDFGESPFLIVRTEEGREVIFGPENFGDQLRWLDLILTSNQQQLVNRNESVDLSMGGNAVVVR